MTYFGWKSKSIDKIITELLSSSFHRLISCGIGSTISCKVVDDDKDIFVASATVLQVQKISSYHLEGGSCEDGFQGVPSWKGRSFLLDTLTFVTFEVLNVSLHVVPVEPMPGQVHRSLCSKVAHFFM